MLKCPALADESFDFILDKATLDALLTAGAESATRWRAAAPPGAPSSGGTRSASSAADQPTLAAVGGTVGCVSEQQAEGVDKAEVVDQFGGLDLATRCVAYFLQHPQFSRASMEHMDDLLFLWTRLQLWIYNAPHKMSCPEGVPASILLQLCVGDSHLPQKVIP